MKQEITVTRAATLVPFNVPEGPYNAELTGAFTGLFTLEQYIAGRWEVLSEHDAPALIADTAAEPALLMWRCHSITGTAVASLEVG